MTERKFQCRLCQAQAPVWARSGNDASVCYLCEPLTDTERAMVGKALQDFDRHEANVNNPPFAPTCEGEE